MRAFQEELITTIQLIIPILFKNAPSLVASLAILIGIYALGRILNNVFTAIICVLLGVAWVGVGLTGNYQSIYFYLFPLAGVLSLKIKIHIPVKAVDFWITLAVLISLFLLKCLTIQNNLPDTAVFGHVDDLFYCNLGLILENFGVELFPHNISKLIFDQSVSNNPWYHYIEIYFMIPLRMIQQVSYFDIFHFVLIPLMHALAILIFGVFIRTVYRTTSFDAYLLAIAALCTLRYNLIDDYLIKYLMPSLKKVSFFQNYPYYHFLSYWGGLKQALLVIFSLPIIYQLFFHDKKHVQAGYVLSAWVASILNMVNSVIIIFQHYLEKLFKLNSTFYMLVNGMLLAGVVYYYGGVKAFLMLMNSHVVENYYWQFSPFLLIALFNSKFSSRQKIMLGVALLYPLVYFNFHQYFKFYLAAVFITVLINYKMFRDVRVGRIIAIFLAFLVAGILLSHINHDLFQVFENYIFIIALFICIALYYHKNPNVNFILFRRAVLSIFIVLAVVPAIFYDWKIPTQVEKVVNAQKLENDKKINLGISIANFASLPFIHHDLLGNFLTVKFSNYLTIQGGYELLTEKQLQYLFSEKILEKDNPLLIDLKKLSPGYYLNMAKAQKINYLIVENSSNLIPYHDLYRVEARHVLEDEQGNYKIYLF